ncbi:hypothetical protein ACFY9H_31425 [Streptomyces bacillaris]|uniref:hypothetical protein n=1 Tax=Streptomyces bacillaris TaxID=68179 RepID=UPI0036ED07E0
MEAARVASANRWLAQHADRPRPGELPQPRDAVSLLTMISIMVRTDTHAFGPLSKLGYLLGPSPSADAATVKDLHQLGWIAPTTPATTGDFAFREDHTAEAVFVDRVRHRPRTR